MPPPPPGCPIPGAAGCVGAFGPRASPVLFVGEAAGHLEVLKLRPFVGPAGDELDRLLDGIGWARPQIVNALRCHPPGDYLVGAPWEQPALDHCSDHLESVLAEGHKVVVTLGATALRAVLRLPRTRSKDGVRVQDFHGAPIRDPLDRFWVVPTFHPSFLLQGGAKFRKVVSYDLQVARDLAEGKLQIDTPSLVIDPTPEWFAAWVDAYLEVADEVWLSPDVETPEKATESDEGELQAEARTPILRINFASSVEEGITIPWAEPYLPSIRRALASPGVKVFWNAPFDTGKLRSHGFSVEGPILDFMDAFKVFQSSLPRGLGFVTPFYSHTPPWKHLGSRNLTYCALDPVMALRCAFGLTRDLQAEGLWPVFERRMTQLDSRCFRPAEKIGLLFDRAELERFDAMLGAELLRIDAAVAAIVPIEICPLAGPLVNRPEGEPNADIVSKIEEVMAKVCARCSASEVAASHMCDDLKKIPKAERTESPALELRSLQLPRFYRREPFKATSWQQVLAYIKLRKHKPDKAKKTKKDTTDKKTLLRLVKTGDPLYPLLLEHRRAKKMKGTYAEGMLGRMDSSNRVHPTFTNTPSTLRKACVSPNLQNVASHVQYAPEFRRCVVAAPGCRLLSADFSGIEAVGVGYFSGDPDYIRLAKLGIHAYLTGFLPEVNQPPDLKWSDADLRLHFTMLKERFDPAYNRAKRCVHGRNYGLTANGMSDYYPEVFPTRGAADKIIALYEEVCPKLRPWWAAMRKFAHENHYLGGPFTGEGYAELIAARAHPFGYKHWFWNVLNFRKVGGVWKEYLGEDAKRALAFLPQSMAMGIIQEAMLRLFDASEGGEWIGDAYFGETPLRAQIHDDLTLEVPEAEEERVRAALFREMTRPVQQLPLPPEWGLGSHLSVGVEMKIGRNWGPFSESNPEGMKVVGTEDLAADCAREEEEDEDEA